MKKIVMLLLGVLLMGPVNTVSAQNDNEPTEQKQQDCKKAKKAKKKKAKKDEQDCCRRKPMKLTQVDVPYVQARNYFVNNNVDTVPSKITTQEEFDKYLSPAAFMGDDGQPTEIDFTRQFVIVVSPGATDVETAIFPVALRSKYGRLQMSYLVATGEKMSYTMRPLLLIVVDKQYDAPVDLIEKQQTVEEGPKMSASTLIIYYDPAIGKQALLDAVKARGAEVIYDYKNFNAIAITIGKDDNIEKAQQELQQINGVLQVNRDQIMKLDSTK